ncbi:hypothetical protein [Kitasatospora sp. NPDC050463]|uniref:hypothetical protein n=1 Tax=Kitasatospora sp. NPDC050463 TaxID=3155786 RepID=UPI00340E2B55
MRKFDVARFREVLAQVLGYGRADALPTRLAVLWEGWGKAAPKPFFPAPRERVTL